MTTIPIAATLAAVLGRAACQKHETAAETRADVPAAGSDASKDVAEAGKDADTKVADAWREEAAGQASVGHEVAIADERVAIAEAKGAYKVAIEKCEALTGDARSACTRPADAELGGEGACPPGLRGHGFQALKRWFRRQSRRRARNTTRSASALPSRSFFLGARSGAAARPAGTMNQWRRAWDVSADGEFRGRSDESGIPQEATEGVGPPGALLSPGFAS